MKKLGLALVLTLAGVSAASAQNIRIGPGGIGVDVDDRRDRRVIERRVERDRGRDERVIIRRDRELRTGSVDRCRTTIVRRENRFGEQVTRRIRECD